MATLMQRYGKGKDTPWYIVMRDHAGKQKWIKGFTDKAETQRMANRLEDEKVKIQRGDIDPQHEARKVKRSQPIAEHIDAYESHLEAKGSSHNHVSYTVKDVRDFVQHSGVEFATAITWSQVDEWVISRKDLDTPRTINRRVGSLQAFLRHLQSQGGVTEYALMKYPKQKVKGTEKRKRRALTVAESAKLIAGAPEPRKTVYRFALLTGFRFSEVASMTPTSFNFAAKTITVKASDAKNKSKDQTVPMHPELVKTLKKLCEGKGRDEQVFVMPDHAATTIREDCTGAKVDPTHIDFHALRHTFITRLAESNIHPSILQELARHSDLATTLGYYVHFKQADAHAAIAGLKY